MSVFVTALLLSRLQFAFTISYHIIFPSLTIGLAAWLTVLEGFHLATGRVAYRVLFDFWLKIFAVAFALGVVSEVVMAFQIGTNWSVQPPGDGSPRSTPPQVKRSGATTRVRAPKFPGGHSYDPPARHAHS